MSKRLSDAYFDVSDAKKTEHPAVITCDACVVIKVSEDGTYDCYKFSISQLPDTIQTQLVKRLNRSDGSSDQDDLCGGPEPDTLRTDILFVLGVLTLGSKDCEAYHKKSQLYKKFDYIQSIANKTPYTKCSECSFSDCHVMVMSEWW